MRTFVDFKMQAIVDVFVQLDGSVMSIIYKALEMQDQDEWKRLKGILLASLHLCPRSIAREPINVLLHGQMHQGVLDAVHFLRLRGYSSDRVSKSLANNPSCLE